MSIRALLLYSPAGGGHRSAAHAVANAIAARDPSADVEVRDVLDFAPAWFRYDRAWSLLQRRGGTMWDWMFDVTDRPAARAIDHLRLPLHRALLGALDRHLIATRPTHVVCTHYLPAIAVARARASIDARCLTVITDHTLHGAWIAPDADLVCVADDAVAREVQRRRPDAAVAITGIPIAPVATSRPIAAELTRARVLVLLGGVPARDAIGVIESLAPIAPALHVLTGDDLQVRAAAARRLPGAHIEARVDGLAAALDAADVVVTKAGGLVVSECLARGRAMVLPFRAPGQERGNRAFAVDAGAAVALADPAETGATLAALIAAPGRLRHMGARARLAARPDAADQVARALLCDRVREVRRHAA